METSLVQSVKLAIVSLTDLTKDALHIHAGLGLFFIAAAFFRDRSSLLRPWGIVLLAAILGEVLDMRDDSATFGYWRWRASLHDVLNTIVWPTVLVALHHFRFLSGTRNET